MEDPNKEDLQAQIEWMNKNMPDQAAPGIQLRQYFDKERRPIRLIATVMPEQTTDIRVTWWTQGQGSERLEWNFNATLDTTDASIQELQDEIRAEVLVQWKLQVEGSTDLLPWPEDLITVVEVHSTVSFFSEVDDVKGRLISMS